MRRRDFVSLLAGAAAWPFAAQAQQAAMPTIGFLHSGSAATNTKRLDGFRKGLSDASFVEGRNLAIEYRWADGHNDRLAVMAADLVQAARDDHRHTFEHGCSAYSPRLRLRRSRS